MRLSFLAVAALCVSSIAAHADTYQLFNINGLLNNGAAITGTLNINLSSTSGDQLDLTYTLGSTSTKLTGTNTVFGSDFTPPYYAVLEFGGQSSPFEANLVFPTLASYSFQGYLGGLCTLTTPCSVNPQSNITFGSGITSTTFDVVSGSSTPAAIPTVTPEPSSFALLGTGALGMAGLLRKRYIGA